VLSARRAADLLRAFRTTRLLRIIDDRLWLSMTTDQEVGRVDTTTVWREFRGRLLGFIARRVDSAQDAEDILQEVMLRIHQHRDELDRVQKVSAWVYRIASNAIIDHYRRPARRERPAGADVEPAGPATVGAEGPDLAAELAACLRPMLDRLPPKHRQAIMLTEFGGVTQAAAAAQLGLSVSGMKTRVQRARRQLRAILLDCCHVDLDRRGGVTDFHSRGGACQQCAPDGGRAAAEPPVRAGHRCAGATC
jgi:RNA polymerase sigma-70 factor (ECF subfamily)